MHTYVASFTSFVATLNRDDGLKERYSATSDALILEMYRYIVASAGVPATLHRYEQRSRRCQGSGQLTGAAKMESWSNSTASPSS